MDTRFELWKQTAFGPETSRFSWRLAVTEERNRQATEIHPMLVPDLAGILLHLEAAKSATQSRHGEPEEQLFVFRTLEISNVVQPGVSKPLSTEAQHFLHFGGSWHGYCKT